MVILVDTREQRPLPFKCPTKRVKLDTGDYSVDGIQTVFRAERKRPKELWSCVGVDRERFRNQLERLSAFPYPMLVIERSITQLRQAPPNTRLSYSQVSSRLMRWSMSFGIPLWFLGGSKGCIAQGLEQLFEGIYDAYRRDMNFPAKWKVMTDK